MIKRKLSWLDGFLALGLAMIIGGLALAVKDGVWREDEVKLVRGGAISKLSVQNDANVGAYGNTPVLYIDISGAVVNPGVYEMKSGDRVIDVLKVCQGLSAEADRQWVSKNINRARPLKDGEKIYIPEVSETSGNLQFSISNLQTKEVLGEQTGLVNINTATISELDRLPGVGPAIAQRIIDYRQENGGFVSVEEIKLVSGIGDKMFEKIKDLIEI